jgi:hypothetical protein
LDYLYTPSEDVAADLRYFVDVLGATFGFAIEDGGVRVAMVELGGPPAILLTDHLEGDRPILLYAVDDVDATREELDHFAGIDAIDGLAEDPAVGRHDGIRDEQRIGSRAWANLFFRGNELVRHDALQIGRRRFIRARRFVHLRGSHVQAEPLGFEELPTARRCASEHERRQV